MNYCLQILILLTFITVVSGQQTHHWNLTKEGIEWSSNDDTKITLDDNIEMSGQRVSAIVYYKVDTSNIISLERDIIFPQYHPLLKSTDADWKIYRAYFRKKIKDELFLPKIYCNGRAIIFNAIEKIDLNGKVIIEYKQAKKSALKAIRTIFPSIDESAYHEKWELINTSDSIIQVASAKTKFVEESISTEGEKLVMSSNTNIKEKYSIRPRAKISFGVTISVGESKVSTEKALDKRMKLINSWRENLVFDSPDKVLNKLFEFSKLRGSESIFQSKMGLIHSPGGGRYYVGFWANDQAEYISPFFPYLGYHVGNTSAMNCYRAFRGEINDEYNPLRYAFEMEGTVPAFQLDRGDAAMIAYGASQFLLANASEKDAVEIWPLVEWCLEYNNRKLNASGVVESESDEMEGRIETGKANLSTSSLYYGGLIQGAFLAKAMGKKQLSEKYLLQAEALSKSIELYFGKEIDGLETYQYYEGHDELRHWICLPLVVGINKRKEGTIEALFDRLWSENGVYVEKNNANKKISEIFWDRGTLYALRGTFIAGETELSYEKFREYSEKRLLGDRVPYAVEAYPEGSMAHLSAESGLYCRVITEGMFGFVATGFDSFMMTPRLPKEWKFMSLKKIKAFNSDISIEVKRRDKLLQVIVVDNSNQQEIINSLIKEGESVQLNLKKK